MHAGALRAVLGKLGWRIVGFKGLEGLEVAAVQGQGRHLAVVDVGYEAFEKGGLVPRMCK